MFEYLPPLNERNLPYPDTIHPIVVHFVIACALFAVVCDAIGYFTKNPRFYEVGWWNLSFSTISIFIAIIFGQIEAGLSEAYSVVEPTLNLHSIIGWSLAGIISSMTAWRYVLRSRDPKTLPFPFLGAGAILGVVVLFQVYLGDILVWVYGMHTIPVVEAARKGVLP